MNQTKTKTNLPNTNKSFKWFNSQPKQSLPKEKIYTQEKNALLVNLQLYPYLEQYPQRDSRTLSKHYS